MLHCVADVPQWDPDAGGPAYVYMRVADHIAARIAARSLPAEARLPAERDLAAEYAVAIGTARRAVLELRDRGLVVTLPGKGTYVVGRPRVTMWATALTTAAALPVLRPPTSPGPTQTNQTIGRAGRGAPPPAELGRASPPVPAYVAWAAEEVSPGVLYALFAEGQRSVR